MPFAHHELRWVILGCHSCPNYTVFPAIQDSQAGPKDQMHQDSWHRFRRQVTHRKIPKSPQWFQWSLGYDLGWNGKKIMSFPHFPTNFPQNPSRSSLRGSSWDRSPRVRPVGWSCWPRAIHETTWRWMEMDLSWACFMGNLLWEYVMRICYGWIQWNKKWIYWIYWIIFNKYIYRTQLDFSVKTKDVTNESWRLALKMGCTPNDGHSMKEMMIHHWILEFRQMHFSWQVRSDQRHTRTCPQKHHPTSRIPIFSQIEP